MVCRRPPAEVSMVTVWAAAGSAASKDARAKEAASFFMAPHGRLAAMEQDPDPLSSGMGWRGARRWLLAVAAALALPIVFLAVKHALLHRTVRRIAEGGAMVISWSEAPGLGWMPAPLRYKVQRYYLVRESYEVHVGDPWIGCGVGITLMETRDSGHPKHGDDTVLVALPSLPNIDRLFVRDSPVTDAGLQHVGALSRLTLLTLEHTNVTGTGFVHLRGLPLEHLSLDGSPIDDAGLSALPDLPALVQLDLSGTLVTGRSLSQVRRFPALAGLYLSATKVDDDALRHLEGLPLKSLNLSKTTVSDAGLARLERLPRLERLFLCRTRVSQEAVDRSSSAAVRESLGLCSLML
jgi:hypothetical protein